MKFSDNLIRAINSVNQDVAADVDFTGVPKKDHLLVMAETCLDAGRLEMFGHKEADAEYRALLEEHGYDAVLKEAAKHVSLW